jgi:hypothetical protein
LLARRILCTGWPRISNKAASCNVKLQRRILQTKLLEEEKAQDEEEDLQASDEDSHQSVVIDSEYESSGSEVSALNVDVLSYMINRGHLILK